MKERSFLLSPGRTTYAAISPTSIDADEAGIKSIDPTKRNCYFKDEYPLKVHKNYTRANCLLECYLDYALSKMSTKCYPWYLPAPESGYTPCDPWQTKEFNTFMEQIPDKTCDYCLPDCQQTIYETSITSAPFRRCDAKNLGTSLLCNLDPDAVANPPIWAHQVLDDYSSTLGVRPSYLSDSLESNDRRFVSRSAVFTSLQAEEPNYDAYEKDLAVAHFFLAVYATLALLTQYL